MVLDPKQFQHHTSPNIPEIEQLNLPEGRRYKTPDGKLYPSITTVLGAFNTEWLDEWRERVGEEEANAVSKRATHRGTILHEACEDYLNNNLTQYDRKRFRDSDILSFKKIKCTLDEKVDIIHHTEISLYSNKYRIAGQCDLIAEFMNSIAIIDFKTSNKAKEKSDIENYFIQETAYSLMYEELTGIKIEKLVIIMEVHGSNVPLIFIENRNNWIDKFIDLRKRFAKEFKV